MLASADTTLFGSETMRVQTALAQWGFMFSQVDGKLGDNTRVAIKSFKEYMANVDPTFGVTPTPVPTAALTVVPTEAPTEAPAAVPAEAGAAFPTPYVILGAVALAVIIGIIVVLALRKRK